MAAGTRRATLKDVAKEAGLSVGMASRVLGDYGYYSEETRTKVLRAAKKLDYRRNAVARSLRVGHTRAIGVLVSDIVAYHWTIFVRGVEEAAAKRGYQVILCNTDDDPRMERMNLAALYERSVDGVIISASPGNQDLIRKLSQGGFPIVLVEGAIPGLKVPRISVDDHGGAYEATEHLIGLGHRRIGLVAGSPELSSGVNRLRGYRDALRQHDVEPDDGLIAHGDYRFDKAYQATTALISHRRPPTAILVCNELMTGATLQCLKDNRMAVPDEMSLIAFDDPAWAAFMNPALTTVRTPRRYIGTLACETLMAAVLDPQSWTRRVEALSLKTELIVRESCRPMRR